MRGVASVAGWSAATGITGPETPVQVPAANSGSARQPEDAVKTTKITAATLAAADVAYQASRPAAVIFRCGARTVGSSWRRATAQLGVGSEPAKVRLAIASLKLPVNQHREFFLHGSPPSVLARLKQRPQPLGNRLARAEYPRPDGADRAIHDRRYVLVTQAFDFAQRDGVAQFFWQLIHRVAHGARNLLGHHYALGRIDIAQLLAVLETFGILGIELGHRRGAPPHRHQIVFGRIDADPVQPRVKGALAPERRQRAVCLDECLLCDILDLGGVPNKPSQQARQLALVLRHEQLESMLVAPLRPLDQLPVEIPLIHPPPSLTKRVYASV